MGAYSSGMATSSFKRFVLPEILFGRGSLDLAGRYARGFEARRALLVSDPGVAAAGWTDRVAASLREAGLGVEIFLGASPNPRDHEVAQGLELCAASDCDLIVAVGGGSPMDCAKAIAICATNGGSILAYEGVDQVPLPGLPLLCLPTTAGTSADISQFAIINDTSRKVKIAIISKKTVPDAALIDPVTTSTMPSALTAATGLDALCHATEAYVSLGASPLTDLPSLEAARLVGRHLVQAYEAARLACDDGPIRESLPDCADAEDSRHGMMLASLLAGQAFSNASLGLCHAMAHALGGFLDAPHGLCNALLLDQVALCNAPAADARYADLAASLARGRLEARGELACGDGREFRPAPGEGAAAFAAIIRELRAELGITSTLSSLGVARQDIHRLALFARKDPCLATNPRLVDVSDIEAVFERAF